MGDNLQREIRIELIRKERVYDDPKLYGFSIPESIAMANDVHVKYSQIRMENVQTVDVPGERGHGPFTVTKMNHRAPLTAKNAHEPVAHYLVIRRPIGDDFESRILPSILRTRDLDVIAPADRDEVVDDIVSGAIWATFNDDSHRPGAIPVVDRKKIEELRDFTDFVLDTIQTYFQQNLYLVCLQFRRREGFAILKFTGNAEESIYFE